MMKKILANHFTWIFLLLIFCHCEQFSEVEVDIPFEGEKMVVYGTISNTGIARTEIWLTSDLNTNQGFPRLEGVNAEITDQNGQTFPLVFDKNIGFANISFSDNNSYALSANYQDLSIISTEVTIPAKPVIIDYSINFDVDSTEVTIKTEFQDNMDSMNFYSYSIAKIENGVLLEEIPADFNNLISDKEFNGEIYELIIQEKLEFPVFGPNFELIRVARPDQMIVKLYNVSKVVDDFYTSLKNTSSEIGNQFSEQDPLVTNIQNGYGYFGGVAVDSIVIDL